MKSRKKIGVGEGRMNAFNDSWKFKFDSRDMFG